MAPRIVAPLVVEAGADITLVQNDLALQVR
jgi:hypothetical protein